MLITDKI